MPLRSAISLVTSYSVATQLRGAAYIRRYDELMSARTLLTFEQFEQLHDDGLKHELLEGEHIVLPPPKSRHNTLQHRLLRLLQPYVDQHRVGDVRIEAGFKLSDETWLQPDVSFLGTAQIERARPNGYFEGSPAVAVEVASESNTAAQLDRKMEQYFAHDSEEVWVVYPETQKIRIHFPDGSSRTASGALKSDVFPGWSASLAAVFEA
jgi:Uma2 family endonuclease